MFQRVGLEYARGKDEVVRVYVCGCGGGGGGGWG